MWRQRQKQCNKDKNDSDACQIEIDTQSSKCGATASLSFRFVIDGIGLPTGMFCKNSYKWCVIKMAVASVGLHVCSTFLTCTRTNRVVSHKWIESYHTYTQSRVTPI